MQPRVSEIRKVAALLDQEWDDVDDLARAVTQAVMDAISERDLWCVVAHDDRLGVFTFGPFDTEGRARKAIGTSIVSPGPQPMQGWVRKLMKEKE